MSKTRIENFSDGVFSIIITLMVFQFKKPVNGSISGIFNTEFFNMLLVYLATFLTIAGFWIGHHLALSNLQKADTTFLWINIAVIFPVTLLPFSTLTYGNYETSSVAALFYTINYLVAKITSFLLIAFVIRRRMSLSEKIRRARVAIIYREIRIYLYIGIPMILAAIFLPSETIYLILLLTFVWIYRSIQLDKRLAAAI